VDRRSRTRAFPPSDTVDGYRVACAAPTGSIDQILQHHGMAHGAPIAPVPRIGNAALIHDVGISSMHHIALLGID
jgi:hypothetical protein